MMEMTFDEQSLKMAESLMQDGRTQVLRASSAAINRTLPFARKSLVNEAGNRYVAPKGELKSSVRLLRAGSGSLVGMVKSSGRRLPLRMFETSFPKAERASARVLREHSLQLVEGLFMNNGKIFHRRQPSRYPLAIPTGPAAPQMIGREDSVQKVTPEISDYLSQRFTHEIEFRFKGLMRG